VAAGAGAVAAATTAQYKQGQEAQKIQKAGLEQQKVVQQQQVQMAEQQQATAQQNINRANQKRPDTQAVLADTQAAAGGGAAGTMLTGPQGIDPQQLALGKNTLLGG
jgi:Flp pilus assembly protein TadB